MSTHYRPGHLEVELIYQPTNHRQPNELPSGFLKGVEAAVILTRIDPVVAGDRRGASITAAR